MFAFWATDIGVPIFDSVGRSAPIALAYGVPNRGPPGPVFSRLAFVMLVVSNFNYDA